jgi:hypothetical protein
VKVIRPDTARHPALTLTLHGRPQRLKNYAAESSVMKLPGCICSLAGYFAPMRLVVNRPANMPERFLMNVKSRLATNIK